MTTLINRIQKYVSRFAELANHELSFFIWAPIGITAVTFFAQFWFNDYNSWGENKKFYSTILSGVLGGLFLIIGFVLRETNLTRRRVGMLWSIVFTLIVGVIACVVNMIHATSKNIIIGHMLFGVYIFTLVEISKPTNEFGLSQLFFLMPFLTTCTAYPKQVVPFHFYSGFMYLFGTIWNIVMLHHFEKAYNARQATGEVGIGNEGIAQEVGIGNEEAEGEGASEVGIDNEGEGSGDENFLSFELVIQSTDLNSGRQSFHIEQPHVPKIEEEEEEEEEEESEYLSTYTCDNYVDLERGDQLMRPCLL